MLKWAREQEQENKFKCMYARALQMFYSMHAQRGVTGYTLTFRSDLGFAGVFASIKEYAHEFVSIPGYKVFKGMHKYFRVRNRVPKFLGYARPIGNV